jgi:hypothetical protein
MFSHLVGFHAPAGIGWPDHNRVLSSRVGGLRWGNPLKGLLFLPIFYHLSLHWYTDVVVFYLCCNLMQATDMMNIRLMFAAVKVTILRNALKELGIL